MKNNNLEIYWSVYACSPALLVIKSELGKMDVLWENWTSLNGHRFEYLDCDIMALLSSSRGYCLTSVKLQLFFLTKDTLLAKTTLFICHYFPLSIHPSLSPSLPLTLSILFAAFLVASASVCQSGFVTIPSLCSIFPLSPICHPSFRPLGPPLSLTFPFPHLPSLP